jgi:hypothetical protein
VYQQKLQEKKRQQDKNAGKRSVIELTNDDTEGSEEYSDKNGTRSINLRMNGTNNSRKGFLNLNEDTRKPIKGSLDFQ